MHQSVAPGRPTALRSPLAISNKRVKCEFINEPSAPDTAPQEPAGFGQGRDLDDDVAAAQCGFRGRNVALRRPSPSRQFAHQGDSKRRSGDNSAPILTAKSLGEVPDVEMPESDRDCRDSMWKTRNPTASLARNLDRLAGVRGQPLKHTAGRALEAPQLPGTARQLILRRQFGRASAPTIPQPVQTMRGPKGWHGGLWSGSPRGRWGQPAGAWIEPARTGGTLACLRTSSFSS